MKLFDILIVILKGDSMKIKFIAVDLTKDFIFSISSSAHWRSVLKIILIRLFFVWRIFKMFRHVAASCRSSGPKIQESSDMRHCTWGVDRLTLRGVYSQTLA